MATGVTLSSQTPKIGWYNKVIPWAQVSSHTMKLFGRAATGPAIGLIQPHGQKELTFRADAISPIEDNPIPAGVRAVDNTSSQYYRTVSGTRYDWAQAMELQSYQMTQTVIDQIAQANHGLGKYWGRLYDRIFCWALRPGGAAYDDSGATDAEKRASVAASLTDIDHFKTVMNTENIGTSDVTANTALVSTDDGERVIDSRQVNVLFAGQEDGIKSPTASSWNSLNIEQNQLSVETFYQTYDYMAERGVETVPFKENGRNVPDGYVALITRAGLKSVRLDPKFEKWAQFSKIEMYNSDAWYPQDAIVVNNIVLLPIDHVGFGYTANTPLSSESIEGGGYRIGGIVLGANAIAVSQYDKSVSIKRAKEDDAGRSPTLVLDVVCGMRAIERVSKDNLPRDNFATLCYAQTNIA